ncbi:hypothetical protein HPB49_012337 [Dermacentor silvarum]|uniref:Uncharacterized protein n=1 Tax=Dermacentor silvarum TaxID=543639 RepID=A0ACB8CF12_DERSI|nr:hypothetical protein HPB49_012337 [Dermacentor silvarum]
MMGNSKTTLLTFDGPRVSPLRSLYYVAEYRCYVHRRTSKSAHFVPSWDIVLTISSHRTAPYAGYAALIHRHRNTPAHPSAARAQAITPPQTPAAPPALGPLQEGTGSEGASAGGGAAAAATSTGLSVHIPILNPGRANYPG